MSYGPCSGLRIAPSARSARTRFVESPQKHVRLAENDGEVTFDEVVTARKQRSQQYKRRQRLGRSKLSWLEEGQILIRSRKRPNLKNPWMYFYIFLPRKLVDQLQMLVDHLQMSVDHLQMLEIHVPKLNR